MRFEDLIRQVASEVPVRIPLTSLLLPVNKNLIGVKLKREEVRDQSGKALCSEQST